MRARARDTRGTGSRKGGFPCKLSSTERAVSSEGGSGAQGVLGRDYPSRYSVIAASNLLGQIPINRTLSDVFLRANHVCATDTFQGRIDDEFGKGKRNIYRSE